MREIRRVDAKAIDCVKEKLNFTEIDTKDFDLGNMRKEMGDEYFRPEVLRLGMALEFVKETCETYREEKMKFIRKMKLRTEDYEKNLKCVKSELKKLQPNSELLKEFNSDTLGCRDLSNLSNKKAAHFYHMMTLSKCTLEDFIQTDNYNVIDMEAILLAMTSNLTLDEIVERTFRNHSEIIEKKQLECILSEI